MLERISSFQGFMSIPNEVLEIGICNLYRTEGVDMPPCYSEMLFVNQQLQTWQLCEPRTKF
jgi:hypothetical protein